MGSCATKTRVAAQRAGTGRYTTWRPWEGLQQPPQRYLLTMRPTARRCYAFFVPACYTLEYVRQAHGALTRGGPHRWGTFVRGSEPPHSLRVFRMLRHKERLFQAAARGPVIGERGLCMCICWCLCTNHKRVKRSRRSKTATSTTTTSAVVFRLAFLIRQKLLSPRACLRSCCQRRPTL